MPVDAAPAEWLRYALDPMRAYGDPPGQGVLRARLEDFIVDEDLGFQPDGDGSHLLLRVRKRGANTAWVASAIARAAGVRAADIGFAGLKDRRAVTTQWFSVPARTSKPDWWRTFAHEEFEILEAHPHRRKLKRGSLSGNRFQIRVRAASVDRDAFTARVQAIRERGVPNYFGVQRFGREAANVHAAWAWARGVTGSASPLPDRETRGFILSAARSLIFNAVLAERVREGRWSELRAGDIANLEGTNSVFEVHERTTDLVARVARLDVHPTGPLWGVGELRSAGETRALEERIAAKFDPLPQALAGAGLEQERRSLRLAVKDFEAVIENDVIELSFRLPAGAFATAVVRELIVSHEGEADA